MKKITVHTPTIKELDEFSEKTFNLFLKSGVSVGEIKYLKEYNIFNGIDWDGMPSFTFNDQIFESPSIEIKYKIGSKNFVNELSKLIGQLVSTSTTYIWYPKRLDVLNTAHLRYITAEVYTPRYPIYIISKGRSETRYTSKFLEKCK